MNLRSLTTRVLLPFSVAALTMAACADDSSQGDSGSNQTTGGGNGDETTNGGADESGGASESGDADTGMDGGPVGACMSYCGAAMTNCTGDNAVYPGMDECMAACGAMPEGTEGATDGNSAWCRAYHAGDPASMDPATHCPHATANGGSVCGSYCESYCDQVENNCTDADAAYPGRDECMAACAAFPEDGAFNATDGNSVQCRTYHASFPAAGDAAAHCAHTSSNGAAVCGSLCEGYCTQAMSNCSELYADEAECMTACEAFPTDGDWATTAGDSVQCRTYHASFPAAGDGATHCPHAAADGGGVCV